jgi:hypothetical protein
MAHLPKLRGSGELVWSGWGVGELGGFLGLFSVGGFGGGGAVLG